MKIYVREKRMKSQKFVFGGKNTFLTIEQFICYKIRLRK